MRLQSRAAFPQWRSVRLFFIAALSLVAACSVQLIQPYDETVDQGVTQFYEEFLGFVADMNRKANKPEGTFARNTAFYDKWIPKLTALADRSLAKDPAGSCPGTETFGGFIREGLGRFAETLNRAPPGPDAGLSGDCTARLLRLLQLQLQDFAAFHEAQGGIGLPAQAAQAPAALVGISTRAVLYTELAKKSGKGA
jgi:hypothetical protein